MHGARLITLCLLPVLVPAAAGAELPGAEVGRSGGRSTLRPLPGDTLSLREAVRSAMANSPEVAVARAELSAESAGRWADWGGLLPRLDAGADFARLEGSRITFQGEEGVAEEAPRSIDFVRKGARQGLFFQWTLLDGGRRYFDIKEGDARRDAAAHRVARRERVVAARVKRHYFQALKEQKLVDVYRRQLEARRAELRWTRDRHEAGSVGRIDLLGARKEVQEARARLLGARGRASAELRRLKTAMGEDPRLSDSLRLAPVDVPGPGEVKEEELVERAVTEDPQLLALEDRAAAASAATGAAWTRYLPEIDLYYDRFRSEIGGPSSDFLELSPRDDFNQVSLSVSWSVFGGFARREERMRGRAEARRARARRRARALELRRKVRNRLEEIRRRHERLGALEESFRLARERLGLARLRYEADRMAYDRYQSFIDAVIRAEREYYSERYAYLRSWAALEELTGKVHFVAQGGE